MGISYALLWPVRQRCAGCRKYFSGPNPIAGLWCSYACAGLPEISNDPADWPRQHFVFVGGKHIARKKAHALLEQAQAEAARWPGKHAYRCSYCQLFHIGGVPKEQETR